MFSYVALEYSATFLNILYRGDILDFLSSKIKSALNKCRANSINELRIRNNRPIIVNISGKDMFLSENGYSNNESKALIAGENEAENVVIKASEYSLYAINENLKNGYITVGKGVRIGICGEMVMTSGQVSTCKNITSILIRVARDVKNCASEIINKLNLTSTLSSIAIISPPGGGKTTIVRDLAREISKSNNVVIIDERYEIASQSGNCYNFNVGNCDVCSGGNKEISIRNSIRSCAPNVIVTDEITANDYQVLHFAKTCGIDLFATIHAKSIDDLRKKQGFEKILNDKIFDYFVVLSNRNNPGKVLNVYNSEFSLC